MTGAQYIVLVVCMLLRFPAELGKLRRSTLAKEWSMHACKRKTCNKQIEDFIFVFLGMAYSCALLLSRFFVDDHDDHTMMIMTIKTARSAGHGVCEYFSSVKSINNPWRNSSLMFFCRSAESSYELSWSTHRDFIWWCQVKKSEDSATSQRK